MTPEILHTAARASVEQMALALVAGTGIAIAAAGMLRVVPRQRSSARFALWFSALLATAALPLVALGTGLLRSAWWRGFGEAGVLRHGEFVIPESWAIAVFVLWAVVAGVMLARVGAGLWQLRQVRRSCVGVDLATIDPDVAAILQQRAGGRRVQLCTSERVRVPAAIGLYECAIVLPPWLLTELSGEELKQVILHELSHLRRFDDWTNVAQKIVKALLFFHPAVWWLDARLALEREMACDDAVLAASASPRRYAECLARLAERSLGRRGAQLAQAAVARVRQTTLRVTRILDVNRPTAGRAGVLAGSLAAVAICIAAISAQQVPQWIAFSDDSPAAATAGPTLPPSFYVPASLQEHPADVRRVKQSRSMAALNSKPMAMPHATPHSALRAAVAPQAFGKVRPARQTPAQPADVVVMTIVQHSSVEQGWQVQVWQLTVWFPAERQAATQVPQKSI